MNKSGCPTFFDAILLIPRCGPLAQSAILIRMQSAQLPPVVRDLVLIGGGHSHVQVLKKFAMQPEPGVRVTLISRERESPYSGMLPGCISGVYQREDIHIQLDRLCRFAGARLIQGEVIGLDLAQNQVQLQARPALHFDVLSINSGAVPAKLHPAAIPVKPISEFLPRWQALRNDIRSGESVAVVGAGAGGVELVMAMRATLPLGVRLFVVGRTLLPGHNVRVRNRVSEKLRELDIEWLGEEVTTGADGGVSLSNGARLPSSRVLWVTNVQAPAWLAGTELASDDEGFIKVNEYLQSDSHAQVFAAGDVAHLVGQQRAKSGVYAVRAGPYLAANLRAYLRGQRMRRYKAQRDHLALIGTGDGEAIASRGEWATAGRVMWYLKDYIDRKFMNKFNNLPSMPEVKFKLHGDMAADLPSHSMRCGGCGAKLAADPLRRVLQRLPAQGAAHVSLGIGDDAAQIVNGGSTTLLTVDGFRAMLDDPYVFGRVAAHHSLNDIFAMGATATAALALVTVPLMSERMMEEDLFQLLSGTVAVLNEHHVPLVGGHSAEGAELSIGLTVSGTPGDSVLHKGGAQPGDRLLLTKPLGTGVILAAAMQGLAPRSSIEAVIAGMDSSNLTAMETFVTHSATSLTDITGFGLAGHLGEMLRAANVGVRLELANIPHYPGAAALVTRAPSSLQQANEQALADYTLVGNIRADAAELALLADPQTSGGLLATVTASRSRACLSRLHSLGYAAADIGEVVAGSWEIS